MRDIQNSEIHMKETLKKILVITSSIDGTVDYVINRYNKCAEFYRLDVDRFEEYEIVVGDDEQWIISCDKWSVKKSDIYSIYYRKPRLPKLNEFLDEYRVMIYRDIIALINGIVDDFEGKVLTKPYILRKTENKVFQLLYAQKNGLIIPESFIGNCNDKARMFANKASIIKPITTGKLNFAQKTELYHTNYFNEFDEDISCTPIYLQEYQKKKYEVRLTFVEDSFWAVRIDSEDKLDWRKNYKGINYKLIDCPDNILDDCIKMLKEFDLKFGAFDFIVDEEETWIFLEINPNGQWQWLEQELRVPISGRIVRFLTD